MKRHLPYDRAARLADQLYRTVSEVCYTELSDPRLEGVQLTRVRMTKDLRVARVYFHMLNASRERIDEATKSLVKASGVFKRAIGREMPLKFMPQLEFFYDETEDVREHIEEVFEELERKRTVEE